MESGSSGYVTEIDTTLVSIKNKLRKMNHINPYTKKRLTRRTVNSMNEATTIENTVKEHLAKGQISSKMSLSNENDDYKNEQYHKILKDLKEYIQPMQSIDEQLQDLKQNKESLGIMKFDWDVDCEDTFMNQLTLIIAPSKSGKSYLMNQLCYEIPHSFDKICFFMGKASWENKCPQVLKHVANLGGIKTQWINTDKDMKPEWSDNYGLCYEELNDDGSSNFIYNDTTYPSIYIFDDLYTKTPDHWVVNMMDTMACMSRHRKTSCFIAFQGFSRLSNKILDNSTRIFLFYDILGREDLWKKMKIPPPTNLNQVLKDIEQGTHTRWYYLDDTNLEEYVPYDIASKQQAINKMKSKLPKAITDERKRKEVEAKQKELEQLEQELGISNQHTTTLGQRPRTYNLIDIKDAKEVKQKDYTKSISTNEFQFIKKVKHEDGVENSYNQQSTGNANNPANPVSPKVKVKKGVGLRSKYNL